MQYTRIKHSERKAREVEGAEMYDDEEVGLVRMNHDNQLSDKTPGKGWTYGKIHRQGGKKQVRPHVTLCFY